MKDPNRIYPGQVLHIPNKTQPRMIYMGNSSQKRIALTFDDGPEGIYTPKILEILRQKGVKAAFFVIDTNDWSGASSEEILSRVHRNVVPGGIILQHNFRVPCQLDGSIKALPQIIDQLRAQGDEFVTVDQLLGK
ncbi:polysaccharide deacetylase family protein [Saccharococcus caldoxylosilyticus]|nr:peptidoglycan/xylan/chitin deacetylase (PgdA/CDA1 family) [Parageobacillus caldoxylosilyticus]